MPECLRRYQRKRARGRHHRTVHPRVGASTRAVRHGHDHGGMRRQNSVRGPYAGAAGGHFLAQPAEASRPEGVMIVDINTYLGHYAFRSLPNKTADKMLAAMDQNGIARAVVSSLHAVFYRDAHRGNQEL